MQNHQFDLKSKTHWLSTKHTTIASLPVKPVGSWTKEFFSFGVFIDDVSKSCIQQYIWSMNIFYLSAENPPNRAPLAIPTQNPIPKPIFIRSKQLGPWPWEYMFDGTAGMIDECSKRVIYSTFFLNFGKWKANFTTWNFKKNVIYETVRLFFFLQDLRHWQWRIVTHGISISTTALNRWHCEEQIFVEMEQTINSDTWDLLKR